MIVQFFQRNEHVQKHGNYKFQINNIKNKIINRINCFRKRGGPQEEIAERDRWNKAEQQKITDSVYGKIIIFISLIYI